MGETKAEGGSKLGGWIKALLGTLAGLLSGAVMMYASPLIDRVIKPAKPVANFAWDSEGLAVNFHNRSSGGSRGWWDFGDGSALEPVTKQEIISHTYASPGEFSAKLSLQNIIGDESERTVTVKIDTVNVKPPAIDSIDVTPISPGAFAPATFRVCCKVKNAQLCIWDLGDSDTLEITDDIAGCEDKFVTFSKPGGYVIKLVATNGAAHSERSEVVNVNEPPPGTLAAVLTVNDHATRVETSNQSFTYEATFPSSLKDTLYRFEKLAPAKMGYELTEVRVATGSGHGARLIPGALLPLDANALGATGARNLQLQIASDRHSVKLTGELVKDSAAAKGKGPMPSLVFPVVLVQQRKSAATRPPVAATTTLPLPGSTPTSAILTLPTISADWVDTKRTATLALVDGDNTIWQGRGTQLPHNAVITYHGRQLQLNVTQLGAGQVKLDLAEFKAATTPTAN
jgi:PKD repeat protein